jgi:predicted Zn-dependent protease
VTVYRRLPWSKIINRAAEAANADQLDSAEYYAKQSLVIYDKGPHAYNVLASVATKKNDVQAARAALKKTIETSGTDTSYRKLRQTSMYNLAVLTQNVAENTEGPEKAALTKESADLFEAYTKEVPDDPNAKTALARLRGEAGDTAAMTSIYADMLRDPTKFTDIQLFEAGSNAARANRNQDAVKLLEAGLKKNPYYRDALFNLATTYFQLKQPEPMAPVVKRLVEVDPNNPDNWRLYAGLFQLKQNSAKGAQKKAATDTLLKYLQRSETMPVRVTFNQFTHNGGKHSLAGSVENRGDKALNNVALKIEFLDQSGSVVASQTAQVGTVAPKGSQSFTVEANQQGIVAFRYAPIPTS